MLSGPKFVLGLARNTANGLVPLGSAFGVGTNLLATAAHLVADDSNLAVVIPAVETLADYQPSVVTQVKFAPTRVLAMDPIRDLAILELDVAYTGLPPLGSTDEVLPGERVSILGFPHMDWGRYVLTHFDVDVGARVMVESRGLHVKHIVVNTQARNGQSGGPVLSATGRVVAVIVGSFAPGQGAISLGGIDPRTLHQTTHAVSAEYVREMLNDV